jgi:hypothetical protein
MIRGREVTRLRKLAAALVVLALVAAGCGDDDTGAGGTPPDPHGLSALPMPETEADIRAVLAAMPGEIDGNPRGTRPDYDLILSYGEANSIVALPMEGATASLAEDLARFELEDGAVVEGSGLSPSSSLVWVQGSFRDGDGAAVVFIMVWGEPDGDWAFNVSAESAEIRDAIVAAFVTALG